MLSVDFFIEQPNSVPYRTNTLPLFSHALWSTPNVYPEINGTVGRDQFDSWAFSTSGLASGIVNTYKYWERNLAASGLGLTKYAFRIVGIGNGSASGANLNSIYLMCGQTDLQVGATGSGPAFQQHLAPWAPTGISNMLTWGTGFWPLVKSYFTASGLRNPDLMTITTELIPDDSVGLVYPGINATGWVTRALADSRANSILFNGVETFNEYWTRVGAPVSGDLISSDVVLNGSTEGWQYLPENQPIRHKWQAAYFMGHSYATLKGIIEPFTAQFGNIPVAEYLQFASSTESPTVRTYPDQPETLVNPFSHTAQGPDWYSTYTNVHPDLGVEDPPYWDSNYGWQTTYPRPVGSNLTAAQYASLQYGIAKVLGAQAAAPDKPVVPWVSTYGNPDNIGIMTSFIQTCLENGITQFYVWEPSLVSIEDEADIWYEIITAVNAFVDYRNHATTSYLVSTVSRLGCLFLKF